MSDEKVLSQSEIDRLMSGASSAETAASPMSRPAASNPLIKTVPAEPGATVTSLADRIAALERTAASRGKSEGAGEVWAMLQQAQGVIQDLTEQMQALATRVDRLTANLQATPGVGLHSSFTCGSCGSSGFVATQARCTCCGEAVWWGWYPPRQ